MKINALSIKNTGHVISAYTNNSGRELNTENQNERFRAGVSLRRIRQTDLFNRPEKLQVKTVEELVENSNEISVEGLPTTLRVMDKILIKHKDKPDEVQARYRIKKIDRSTNKLTLERISPSREEFLDLPTESIVHFYLMDHSPNDKAFNLPFSTFELSEIEVDQSTSLLPSRPLGFSLVDEKPIETPVAPPEVKKLTIAVSSTFVELTVVTKTEDSNSSPPKKIPREIDSAEVVCVMRPGSENTSVVSSQTLERSVDETDNTIWKARLSFAVIPAGTNTFLFFIKGFQPIWDQFDLAEQQTSTWTSA